MALAGVLMVSGCDRISAWRKPELAACQRFLQSGMRVPTSFHRNWYNDADIAVSRAMLADAVGRRNDAAFARETPVPAIRDVFIQYRGDDGLGRTVAAVGRCHFALVDAQAGKYAVDLDSGVEAGIHENEARTLMVSLGKPNVTAADCCLAKGFDLARLNGLKRFRRGSIRPIGKL